MQPVIGIVSCGFHCDKQFVTDAYIQVIESSGGIPILIPVTASCAPYAHYENLCDGFLFCGGEDISPRLLHEDLDTDKGSYDQKTDEFHLSFMSHVYQSGLPLLAICRGMQVLSVSLGGTLYQDLSLRGRSSLCHMQHTLHRSDPCHRVSFSRESLLHSIYGEYAEVNSFHHQCIRTPGVGLTVTARSKDGVIEALEAPAHLFCIGLQWHPETMYSLSEKTRHLFRIFVERASYAGNFSFFSRP